MGTVDRYRMGNQSDTPLKFVDWGELRGVLEEEEEEEE